MEGIYEEFIYKRTYARWLESEKRRENWDETVNRYRDFFLPKVPEKNQEDFLKAIEAIRNKENMPSMRSFYTAGKALERDSIAGYNPVVGATKVLTKEFGYVEIKSLEGKSCHVLNKDGVWAIAKFNCYGEQDVYRVSLRKNSNTKLYVDCTANHRWYTTSGVVKSTTDLIEGKVGDKIPFSSLKAKTDTNNIDYRLGLIHGLVFGDGTGQYVQERLKGYSIRICEDIEDTLKLFEGFDEAVITYPPSYKGDPVIQLYGNFAKTHRLKELPDVDETESYMKGFFRGWLAADGSVSAKSNVTLCLNEDYLDWFCKYSAKFGYVVQNIYELKHKTNFGKRRKRGFSVTIDRSSLSPEDFIIKRKRERFRSLKSQFCIDTIIKLKQKEKVYCAEVPDTNTFVLERGLVTGNCCAIAINTLKSFAELMYILMNGTGVGFSVERQIINNLPEIPKEFEDVETNIVFADSKKGWAEGYYSYIRCLWSGEIPKYDLSKIRPKGSILKTFGGRACLTGDTIVYKDRKKSQYYNEITIRDLYEMKNNLGKWKHLPNHFNKIKLRSLHEKSGVFYRNNLIDVIDNGIASVYEIITENGYKIKATMNHRFMNQTGEYDFLENFNIGDLIAVNGSKEKKTGICVDCGCAISRRAKRCKPCYDEFQTQDFIRETSARQRKRCRDYRKEFNFCERCGKDKTRLVVHHKDENPLNNNWKNLGVLCEDCHQKHHAAKRTFGNPYSHKYLSFDTIISIEYVGEERVYDLQMRSPNHNFVANGFVSHNSGPGPLGLLLKKTKQIITGAAGRKLNSLECHDICCFIAEAIVVGGVRRSSGISMSNLSDDRMRNAKSGEFWIANPQRSLANNSVVYTDKPDVPTFISEWRSLIKSGTGERGFINRNSLDKTVELTNRRKTGYEWLLNPCAEIILRPSEFCNLSEVVCRENDSIEKLIKKVKNAVILGCIQATLTDFKFINYEFKKNCEEERLLGVSLTGLRDCQLLNITEFETTECLKELKHVALDTAREWSEILGINMPAAITCVKPSGTVSQLVNSSSGLHTRYAPYYIRRVRVTATDPLCKFLKEKGVKNNPETGQNPNNPDTVVFDFPIKSPENAICNKDITAIDQLEYWKMLKIYWCEHNPSCTIFVNEDEWLDVGAWVYKHWDIIGGLSFLPKDNNIYQLAPYEEITKDEYNKLVSEFPEFDFEELNSFEDKDNTEGAKEIACSSGACELI